MDSTYHNLGTYFILTMIVLCFIFAFFLGMTVKYLFLLTKEREEEGGTYQDWKRRAMSFHHLNFQADFDTEYMPVISMGNRVKGVLEVVGTVLVLATLFVGLAIAILIFVYLLLFS